MTASVEENLTRIKREQTVVDRVSAKLDENQRNLAKIEKQIPAISEEFGQKNAQQLKLIGAELLKQYQDRAEKVDATTKSAVKQNEDLLKQLANEVSAIYENAAKKVQQLEDEAFAKLEEQSAKKTDSLKKNLDNQIKTLQSSLQNQVQDLQGEINSKTAELDGAIEGKRMELSASFDSQINEFDQKLKSKIHELELSYERSLGEARSIASELAKENITVNAICPGYFYTELTTDTLNTEYFQNFAKQTVPMQRYGHEGELNSAAIFLGAEESSYVTGQAIAVDGGYTAV